MHIQELIIDPSSTNEYISEFSSRERNYAQTYVYMFSSMFIESVYRVYHNEL